MSRVFLATERRFGRTVVVKVLTPELSEGFNHERFEREIQLAARLQHPHIVPLLSAGEAKVNSADPSLPYYTMPFAEGESLRAKLAAGPLDVRTVVEILRQVAEALEYAHAHGVVHRDIKPDNILLTGRSAVVTDFGIGKALHAARTAAPAGTITQIGTTIGTPAYMAPEQALGDPGMDHRADIYAFGATAYELLTGSTPFAGLPTHQILAAQIAQSPVPVSERRTDVPPGLAALIMRCLSKNPGDRPANAAELVTALDAQSLGAATPAALTSATRRKGLIFAIGVVAAVVAIVAAAIVVSRRTSGPQLDEELIAIAPFRIATPDASIAYLREGMLDAIEEAVTGDAGVRVTNARVMLAAWRRAARSDTNDLVPEEAAALARRLGARRIALGTIRGNAQRVSILTTMIDARTGAASGEDVRVEGPADSVPALINQLVVKLLASNAGIKPASITGLSAVPLPALRFYLQGRSEHRKGRYQAAFDAFNAALNADSTFASAALGAITSASWLGVQFVTPAERRALPLRDRLSERDRAIFDAYLAFDGGNGHAPSIAGALAAWDLAAQRAPDVPDVWYEYGDLFFHHGASMGMQDAAQRARSAFERALALDSGYTPALEHLAVLATLSGDSAGARVYLRRYLVADSSSDNAVYLRWHVGSLLGDDAEVAKARAAFATASPNSLRRIIGMAMVDGLSVSDADSAARILSARAATDAERSSALDYRYELAVNGGRPRLADSVARQFSDPVMRAGAQLRTARTFGGDSAEIVASLRVLEHAAADRTPDHVAQAFEAACAAGVWRLNARDAAGVERSLANIDTLASVYATKNGWDKSDRVACRELLSAAAAVLRKSGDAAARVDSLERFLLTRPRQVGEDEALLALPRLWESVGDQRRALEAARRHPYHYHWGGQSPADMQLDRARLAAALGARDEAIRAYRAVIALQARAEPSVRPQVDAMRRELARLEKSTTNR